MLAVGETPTFTEDASRICTEEARSGRRSAPPPDAACTVTMRDEDRTSEAMHHLLAMALPNFWFHTTTAYAILRHAGVELGKRDFIGAL